MGPDGQGTLIEKKKQISKLMFYSQKVNKASLPDMWSTAFSIVSLNSSKVSSCPTKQCKTFEQQQLKLDLS